MVVDLNGFSGIEGSFPIQIPQGFLLFGIHTDYRIARLLILLFQLSNALELFIAILGLAGGFLLQCLAFSVIITAVRLSFLMSQ